MMIFIILLVVAASAIYAFTLKRNEERRQEWQRDSRAAWLKVS